MTYIKIGETLYPASIAGKLNDKDWNNRSSKSITLEMSYEEALATFIDDIDWSIVEQWEELEEKINEETKVPYTELVTKTETYDNSDYSIAGDITDHRDGTVTVKMGKLTADELLAIIQEAL